MSKFRFVFSALALLAALVAVAYTTDFSGVAIAASRVPFTTVIQIMTVIAAGYLVASARIQVFAGYAGHPLAFRDAVAAVSAGQIAGTLFFQIVGQVMARSAIFSRSGLPVATTIVITGYERLFALVVSLVLAAAGALSIFGLISVDGETGGYDLAKLFFGGCAALVGGAWIGWGPLAFSNLPKFERRYAGRLIVGLALSFVIQFSTMIAYVLVAHTLAPQIPLMRLAAASSVVMLAASLPISLAGWGVREVSAVFALGAVGVAPGDSLVSAVTIGLLSLVVAALFALISVGAWKSAGRSPSPGAPAGYDFSGALATWLPILAATAVVFQVYLPAGSGKINVNFADPIVILSGALLLIWLIRDGSWARWRLPMVNAFLICFSAVTLIALLNGYAQIGWTSWAFTNKGAGWLVLVCYFATGAMIVGAIGEKGLPALLGTYAGSVTAIATLDLALLLLRKVGVEIPDTVLAFRIFGFAQNPNAFGFQILLALAALIVLDISRYKKLAMATALFAAIWFSGSRASFATALVLLTVAPLTLWGMRKQTFVRLAVTATVIAILTIGLLNFAVSNNGSVFYSLLNNQDRDRFATITGGLALFLKNPWLGSGLGVFVHDHKVQTGDFLPIHSTSVWLLAEYGLLGFLTIFGGAFYAAVASFKGALRGNRADRFIVLALIVFGTMSLVHELLYQRTLWLLLGGALASAGVLQPNRQADGSMSRVALGSEKTT